jgi:hypothetical protein
VIPKRINGNISKNLHAIWKILFNLRSYEFLACLECISRNGLSFGHSDWDISRVMEVHHRKKIFDIEEIASIKVIALIYYHNRSMFIVSSTKCPFLLHIVLEFFFFTFMLYSLSCIKAEIKQDITITLIRVSHSKQLIIQLWNSCFPIHSISFQYDRWFFPGTLNSLLWIGDVDYE